MVPVQLFLEGKNCRNRKASLSIDVNEEDCACQVGDEVLLERAHLRVASIGRAPNGGLRLHLVEPW